MNRKGDSLPYLNYLVGSRFQKNPTTCSKDLTEGSLRKRGFTKGWARLRDPARDRKAAKNSSELKRLGY